MRYLRMLTNSLAAGLLGAAYVVVLVLQLNPRVPLRAEALPLVSTFWLFYAVHLAVMFYAVMVVRQLLASRVLSPGWLSVGVLAWLSTVSAAAAAMLMWVNLRGFNVVLHPDAARGMTLGAAVTSAAALLLLLIAAGQYSFGRRGSWASAAVLVLAAAASVAGPLALRAPEPPASLRAARTFATEATPSPPGAPRVVLIVLDGASLDYISPAAAEGRLANFGRILDTGAAMHVTTMRPTQPAPVWTAVATGKYPPKNGVTSAATYTAGSTPTSLELLPDQCFAHALVHLGFITETPNSSEAVRARPLWDVLSAMGIDVGVVGWPLTYPASPVRGFLISDRAPLGDGFAEADIDEDRAAYPQGVLTMARAAADRAVAEATSGPALAATAVDSEEEGAAASSSTARDRIYGGVASALQATYRPQFLAVRYQGLDAVGHRFLRYAMPRAFGDVSEDEQRRYRNVLERYYAFIDAEVGDAMASIQGDDLLLVVSGFGMEPIAMGKRLLARALGDPDLSGTHEGAPGGFMLAYGRLVSRGNLTLGSIVDVAPTVLYFLGLPVARDMDGYARTDLFTQEFTSQHPIIFIPTYER